MLVIDAGQSATVLVAFALIGGNPSAMSAGNVTSVPAPAIAFMTPAISAETITNTSLIVGNVAGCRGPVDSRDARDEPTRER